MATPLLWVVVVSILAAIVAATARHRAVQLGAFLVAIAAGIWLPLV